MKRLITLALVLALTACASKVTYAPLNNGNQVYNGIGGSGVQYEGIDFWNPEASPRKKFVTLGVIATDDKRFNFNDSLLDRSTIVREVKKQGGDGVIQTKKTTEQIRLGDTAPSFVIIKYVQ